MPKISKKEAGVRRNKSPKLTHLDEAGKVKMVEISCKDDSYREATARGRISLSAELLHMIEAGEVRKGNPLEIARIAGIMAAKKTHELIPLCHPLLLTRVDVTLAARTDGIEIEATVGSTGKTGVEMEALTAVSVAALTIYDMCKAVDKSMTIDSVRLMKKSGGRSGAFVRKER